MDTEGPNPRSGMFRMPRSAGIGQARISDIATLITAMIAPVQPGPVTCRQVDLSVYCWKALQLLGFDH